MIKPFRELRLICDADEHGIGFDLVYRSEYGPISEPQHVRRQGDRILLDASRFAGVGTWEGELRVDGDTIAVTPDRYTATRDRSWGIRPVGEAEPAGPAERLHRHVVVLDPAALRRLRAARHPRRGPRRPAQHELRGARVSRRRRAGRPSSSAGRCPRSATESGTRNPIGASIELTNRDGKKSTLEIEPLIGISLNVGCGYGADPDWTHGLWKGDGWVEGSVYDYNDPAVTGRAAFSLWDHVARVTFEGHEGYGIFEHGCIGPHAPSGFTDLTLARRRLPVCPSTPFAPSVRDEAAVDEEDLAGHEARRVGREVEHRADHLVGARGAAHEARVRHRLLRLGRVGAHHVGVDGAGRERVHADARAARSRRPSTA